MFELFRGVFENCITRLLFRKALNSVIMNSDEIDHFSLLIKSVLLSKMIQRVKLVLCFLIFLKHLIRSGTTA